MFGVRDLFSATHNTIFDNSTKNVSSITFPRTVDFEP